MPVVPPPEEDELVSSWLDRTARFYGLPIAALLADAAPRSRPIELSGLDLGVSPATLTPIAALLGITVEFLAGQTIAAAYPWAVNLVARDVVAPGDRRRPRLRYAACPHCLEQQRAERGFSWLRREWVLAPRTVCSSHHVVLVEGAIGDIAHPVWADFLRRHRCVGLAVSAMVSGCAEPAHATREQAGDRPFGDLHRRMAGIQDAMLVEAGWGQASGPRSALAEEAIMVGDLVWAFTRRDSLFADRLIYEAFASDLLDSRQLLARSRRPGPVDHTNLHLGQRHRMMATATLFLSPPEARLALYGIAGNQAADLAGLARRLGAADRAELAERRAKWPPAGATALSRST
ncbi:MAG: TniQ family protein [Paracraurococcus sp.]